MTDTASMHERTLEREARRVLRHLKTARLERRGTQYVLGGAGGRPKLSVDVTMIAGFRAQGWVAEDCHGRVGLTDGGRAFLARADALHRPAALTGATSQAGFRAQHGEIEREIDGTRIERAGSPLDFLKRFTAADGSAFLSPEQCAAAERLERDFELSHLRPRLTQDFSTPIERQRRLPGAAERGSVTALDARRRCLAALDAAGPGLSDLLFEAVCMARGLNECERGFGWPQRSGKTILRLALERLAQHYGLVSGRRRPGRIETWIAAANDDAAA